MKFDKLIANVLDLNIGFLLGPSPDQTACHPTLVACRPAPAVAGYRPATPDALGFK